MNFLACEGAWTVSTGSISCDGTLVTITSQEIADEVNAASALTLEEAGVLIDASMLLFVAVFGFLVLKKLL
ncbi:MAG: hypothetical protein KAI82_04865 [Tritonibacter mobilis]|nr:hypothetical protein [Tritonibacter mobilis]